MKILLVHNSYQHHGGEDVVFNNEKNLLSAAGHHVSTYTRNNEEINGYGWMKQVSLAPRTVWAWDSLKEMRRRIADERPDITHFHNTFPLISTSAYLACHEARVPVVQTLHNSRLICPAATLSRGGKVCEDCSDKRIPWPAVLHGCYRHSHLQSGVVAAMLTVHRQLKTWERFVDQYVVSTELFARKFAAAGLPANRISIKPNFVDQNYQIAQCPRDYALFVGRLVPEKGVNTLLDAWGLIRGLPLKIRGDGPLLHHVQSHAGERDSGIEWLKRPTQDGLIGIFQGARFLVWPSEAFYENFGLVAIEAFACGVPVIASNVGVMAETIRDGHTGLHFASESPTDLAAKVEWAWSHPNEMMAMGREARREYEEKYTPERNYEMLMNIYKSAMSVRGWEASKSDFKDRSLDYIVGEISAEDERPSPKWDLLNH